VRGGVRFVKLVELLTITVQTFFS